MTSFIDRCTEFTVGEIDRTKNYQYAFVVQGPYYEEYTPKVIKLFLERNSTAAVIVTTYLSRDSLEHARSESLTHCGRLVYISVKLPLPEEEPDFWRTNRVNQNCQVLTSSIGLHYAHKLGIPMVMKIRSDAILGLHNVCKYLHENLIIPHPVRNNHEEIRLRGRIVVLDYCMIRDENLSVYDYGSYCVTDFMFFGYTEDLMYYFDARDGSLWDRGRGIKTGVFAECNLCEMWMQHIGILHSTELPELFGRYFAVASNMLVEFMWLKAWQPDLQRYLAEGKSYLQERHKMTWGRQVHVTYDRWIELVKKWS